MSFEEFGLSESEQLAMERSATIGAAEEELRGVLPILDMIEIPGAVVEENSLKISEIQRELGATEEEAEIILVQRLVFERKGE